MAATQEGFLEEAGPVYFLRGGPGGEVREDLRKGLDKESLPLCPSFPCPFHHMSKP